MLGLLEESVLEGFVLEESSGLGTVVRISSQAVGNPVIDQVTFFYAII